MTKLLSVGVCALGLMLATGAAGCSKKDDKSSKSEAKKDDKADKADKDKKTTDVAEKKDDTAANAPKPAAGGDVTAGGATTKPTAVTPGAAAATGDLGPEIKKAVDEVCKCKDEACAKAISLRMRSLVMKKMAALPSKDKMAFVMKLQKDYKADMDRAKKCAEKFKPAEGKSTGKGLGPAVMKKLSGFADNLCKCKDIKCAQGVQKQMQTWGMEQAKKKTKPNDAEKKAMMPIMKKMGQCYKKLMMAGKKK